MPPMNLGGGISSEDWNNEILPAWNSFFNAADLVVGASFQSAFPDRAREAIVAVIQAACMARGVNPPKVRDIVRFVLAKGGGLSPRCIARLVRLLWEVAAENPELRWPGIRQIVLSQLVPSRGDAAWNPGRQIEFLGATPPTAAALENWSQLAPQGLSRLRWLLLHTLHFEQYTISLILPLNGGRPDAARRTADEMLEDADFVARLCQSKRISGWKQAVAELSGWFVDPEHLGGLYDYERYLATFWGRKHHRLVAAAMPVRRPYAPLGQVVYHWLEHHPEELAAPPVVPRPGDPAVTDDLHAVVDAAIGQWKKQQRRQGREEPWLTKMEDAIRTVFESGGWRAVVEADEADKIISDWRADGLSEGDVRTEYEAVVKIMIDIVRGRRPAQGNRP